MSLFIGGLAFSDPLQIDAVKMGVLSGSLVSLLVGMAVLASVRASRDPQALTSGKHLHV
jgi:NhaA family Na+:H+ antiporter